MVDNIEKACGGLSELQAAGAAAGWAAPWCASHLATHALPPAPAALLPPAEQVLGRGERLELLVEKTDALGQQAFAFKRQARVLRRSMWWQNARMGVAVGAAVLLAAYALVCVICSPTFKC